MKPIADILKPSNLDLPPKPQVSDILWHEFIDSVDDPALRIVVVLTDDTKDEERRWRDLKPIQQRISSALEANGVDLFPYVRFITEKELASEQAA